MAARRARPTTPFAGVALGLLVVGAIGAGCGKELDSSGPERAIKDAVERNYDVEVSEVDCPERVEVEAGATFDCIVMVPEDRLAARVTQTDEDGRVEFELVQQLLTRESVAKAIAQEYQARSVDCGERDFWVSRPGESFRCTAKDETGAEGTIEVTVRDTEGNIDLREAD
jgi:hypothetical protein